MNSNGYSPGYGPVNPLTVYSAGGASTTNNFASFTDNSGVKINDSGKNASSFLTAATASSTYLPLSGGVVTGNINMNSNSLTNVANINTEPMTSFVTNTSTATTNNLCSFAASGASIQDSSILSSNVVTNTGSTVTDNQVVLFSGTTGRLIKTSTKDFNNVVTSAAGGSNGNVPNFGSTTQSLVDSGVAVSSLLTSAVAASTYVSKSGSTMTGTLAMGANNITGTGTVSASTFSSSGTTDSSSSSTGSITTAGGIGCIKSIFAGGNVNATGNLTGTIVSASGNLVGTKVNASTPSCFWSYNTPISAIGYTANTPQLINLGTFAIVANPASDFTTNTNGQVKYTGSTTKWYRVEIAFNIAPSASANTLYCFISKNGGLVRSSSTSGARAWSFTAASSTGYMPNSVSGIFQLATNDTIQLAGEYSATASLSTFDCAYILTAMC